MKKYFLCGLAVLALTGCSSGVSQSDYESVSAELQTAEAEKSTGGKSHSKSPSISGNLQEPTDKAVYG